jgi:hypothetical protein
VAAGSWTMPDEGLQTAPTRARSYEGHVMMVYDDALNHARTHTHTRWTLKHRRDGREEGASHAHTGRPASFGRAPEEEGRQAGRDPRVLGSSGNANSSGNSGDSLGAAGQQRGVGKG